MNKQVMENNELVMKPHKVNFIGKPFEILNTVEMEEKIHSGNTKIYITISTCTKGKWVRV